MSYNKDDFYVGQPVIVEGKRSGTISGYADYMDDANQVVGWGLLIKFPNGTKVVYSPRVVQPVVTPSRDS